MENFLITMSKNCRNIHFSWTVYISREESNACIQRNIGLSTWTSVCVCVCVFAMTLTMYCEMHIAHYYICNGCYFLRRSLEFLLVFFNDKLKKKTHTFIGSYAEMHKTKYYKWNSKEKPTRTNMLPRNTLQHQHQPQKLMGKGKRFSNQPKECVSYSILFSLFAIRYDFDAFRQHMHPWYSWSSS